MTRWMRAELTVVVALLLLAGCERNPKPQAEFSSEEPATPSPVLVLKSDSTRTPRGYRVAQVHVLLSVGIDEAGARATLQHVIDSVAAADTLAAAVQVVGFVVGTVHAAEGTADLAPAISATWGPTDSAGFTGAKRASRYRTHYVVLRPFADTAAGRP